MSNTYDADHRWQNMCAMLDRLGMDASMLAHGRLASDLRSAVTNCQNCNADQACQECLVRAPEASTERRILSQCGTFRVGA